MKTARTLAVLGALAFTIACGASAPEQRAEAAATTPARNPLEITADKGLLARLTFGTPALETVAISQTVAARVEVDQTRVTRVGSPVMGRIAQLLVTEGQTVRRGELLALLNSTGLNDAQLAFLKALSDRLVSERAVDRAMQMLKADVIGVAELQRREAELAQARAEFDAARDQLELLGMPSDAIDQLEKERKINSVSRMVAPMSGTVLSRMLTLGQVIQPADTVFEIADLSHVWLQADVPEQNAGHLRVGTQVDAEVAALPGVKIEGTLSFVSATVNPETRTVRVRMDLPNPDGRFKPAMLATVTLRDQPAQQHVVPGTAIIREGNDEFVFIQTDEDTFLLRPVKLGAELGARRVLLDGVRAGERIVLDGAFHLNNERRRQLLRGSDEG